MIASAVKLFILLTPFFIMSVFIAKTESMPLKKKRSIAFRTSTAVMCIALIVYFAGNFILRSLGITLDAFRIGSGLVLLLSGLEMVRESSGSSAPVKARDDGSAADDYDDGNDISIVPLAIPTTIGPGTIGTLLVMGSNAMGNTGVIISDIVGVVIAVFCIALCLHFANVIEKIVGKRGITILSKLTGLFLTALASQIMAEGVKNLLMSGLKVTVI